MSYRRLVDVETTSCFYWDTRGSVCVSDIVVWAYINMEMDIRVRLGHGWGLILLISALHFE